MTEQNIALGVVATVAAIVGYGSTFVPVKRFETKDGIFASFIMTISALIPYLISAFIYETLSIYPVALLSGVICALGSSLCVFIMNGIGMAAGSLLWNVSMCIIGWAVPRFGLLGFKPEVPEHNLVNAVGVCIIILGGVCCSFVQSTPNRQRKVAPLPLHDKDGVAGGVEFADAEATVPRKSDTVTLKRKILSILAACFTGACYANTPTPLNFLTRSAKEGRQQWPTTLVLSPHPAAYMLSFSVGSIITSTLIFAVNCIYKRNRPFVTAEMAAPAMLSGLIYGASVTMDFVAFEHLDQIIAMPLSTVCPAVIASMWSVFLFKEIKGRKNFLILAAAISVTAVGAIMITLSKF